MNVSKILFYWLVNPIAQVVTSMNDQTFIDAAHTNNEEIVIQYLKYGYLPHPDILHFCLNKAPLRIIEIILDDFNCLNDYRPSTRAFELSKAIVSGVDDKKIQCFLENSGNTAEYLEILQSINNSLYAPILHHAMIMGRVKAAKMLIADGASIYSQDQNNNSVVISAIRSKNIETIKYAISLHEKLSFLEVQFACDSIIKECIFEALYLRVFLDKISETFINQTEIENFIGMYFKKLQSIDVKKLDTLITTKMEFILEFCDKKSLAFCMDESFTNIMGEFDDFVKTYNKTTNPEDKIALRIENAEKFFEYMHDIIEHNTFDHSFYPNHDSAIYCIKLEDFRLAIQSEEFANSVIREYGKLKFDLYDLKNSVLDALKEEPVEEVEKDQDIYHDFEEKETFEELKKTDDSSNDYS